MTELEAHWLLTGMKVSGSSSKQAKGEGFSMLQHIPCHVTWRAGRYCGKEDKAAGDCCSGCIMGRLLGL